MRFFGAHAVVFWRSLHGWSVTFDSECSEKSILNGIIRMAHAPQGFCNQDVGQARNHNFKFALKTRVTSANPEYRLTEVILVSSLEDTSTTFITVLEPFLCTPAIGGVRNATRVSLRNAVLEQERTPSTYLLRRLIVAISEPFVDSLSRCRTATHCR